MRFKSPAGISRNTVGGGLLSLLIAACATDEINLAPESPNEPWQIPDQSFSHINNAVPAQAATAAKPHSGTSTSDADVARVVVASKFGNSVSVDPEHVYGLAELIDLAQRNNPGTREAWERARQAALAVGLVESTYAPQLSAEVLSGYQHTPLPIPTTLIPQGYFSSDTRELLPTLAMKWLLFDFGQRGGAEQAARANSFVANVAFTGAHQKLIYAVCRDFYSLGAARGSLRAANQAVESAKVVQDLSEARQKNGVGTSVEVFQARRQTAQAQFNVARATERTHSAYEALIDSIGVAPSTELRMADSVAPELSTISESTLERLLDEALANRPDMIAAVGKVHVAEGGLRKERASHYPTVALVGQVYENIGELRTQGSPWYSVDKPGGNILLSISAPLFDAGQRDARISIARSELASANDALDEARDEVVRQVRDSYDAVKSSVAEYTAAKALNDAAEIAYDAALESFRNGVSTYPNVISEETALDQAKSDLESAQSKVLTASAALAFATGSINPRQLAR